MFFRVLNFERISYHLECDTTVVGFKLVHRLRLRRGERVIPRVNDGGRRKSVRGIEVHEAEVCTV